MKRVNIQSDVESRRNIATAIPNALVTKPEIVTESRNTQEDGKTEEVQGGENHAPTQTESDTPSKRGRKTKGDTEEV